MHLMVRRGGRECAVGAPGRQQIVRGRRRHHGLFRRHGPQRLETLSRARAGYAGLRPAGDGAAGSAGLRQVQGYLYYEQTTNTGVAPTATTLETEAMKLLGVTMTSSPGARFKALSAASSAKVPFTRATQRSTPAH